MKPLLSVILPVYNVAPYLRRSVDSVISQSYKNMEIILVDDGSTDGSSEICDEYKKKDNRIIVIHQANGGLSDARNKGLNTSSGEWIAFLDSDDWIHPSMYETLIDLAIEQNADMITCKSVNCYEDGSTEDSNSTGEMRVFSSDDMIRGLWDQKYIRFEVWNKIWKRSLIGDVRFKERQVCEDIRFDRLVFPDVNKCVYIDKPLHYYLKARPGSTITSFKVEKLCMFEEFNEWRKSLSSNSDLHGIMTSVENKFAVRLYLMAKSMNQPQAILDKIKGYFDDTYEETCRSGLADAKQLLLFRISPTLYRYLLNFKKRR